MFKQSISLPDKFHVAAVQAATIWTEPESARVIDELATGDPTDIEKWLGDLSKDEKLALSTENRIQTQLLFGEAVVVTNIKEDWAEVYVPSQPSRKNESGYPGWVPLSQIEEMTREKWYRPETAAITNKSAWLEDVNGERLLHVSFMTCLPVERVENDRVEVVIPKGTAYLPKEAVEIYSTEHGGKQKDGKSIVQSGESFIGLEYLWGGMTGFGYDCSGFTYGMHKVNGYQIGRDASDQAAHGKEIEQAELEPGDLLFFAKGKASPHHVGIYYGNGKMLHSPSTGRGIEIIDLAGTKHEKEFCIARRYWKAGEG